MGRGKIFTNRKQKIAVDKEQVKKLAKAKKKEKKKAAKGAKEDKTHPSGGGDYFDPKTGVVFSTRPEDSCIPLMEANITKFLQDQGELENPQDHVTVALHVIDYLSADNPQQPPLIPPPPLPSDMSNEEVTVSFWQEVKDPKTNHSYYWNPSTNEVSWTLPNNAVLTSEASERSDEIQDPENESPTREVVQSSAESSAYGSDVVANSLPKEGEQYSFTLSDVSQDDERKKKKKSNKANGNGTTGKSSKASKESQKLRLQVSNMADEISRKLNYLHVDTETTSELQLLNVKLQARLEDWKEGELSSKFVLAKLKEADEAIQAFVQKEVPEEWECLWDRGTCRYFFKHSVSGEVTWEFPTGPSQGCSPLSSQQETVDSVQEDEQSSGEDENLEDEDDDIDDQLEKVVTTDVDSNFVGPLPPVAPPTLEAFPNEKPGVNTDAKVPEDVPAEGEDDMDLDSNEDEPEGPTNGDPSSLYGGDLPPPAINKEEDDSEGGDDKQIDEMVLTELEAANQEAMMLASLGWKPDSYSFAAAVSDDMPMEGEQEMKEELEAKEEVEVEQGNLETKEEKEPDKNLEEQSAEVDQPTEEELAIAITSGKNLPSHEEEKEEPVLTTTNISTTETDDKQTEDTAAKRSRDDSEEHSKSTKKSRRSHRDDRSDSDYSDDRRRSRKRRSRERGHHSNRHSRKSRKYSDDSDDGHSSRRHRGRRSRSKDRRDRKKKDRKKRYHRESSSEEEKETKKKHDDSSSDEEYKDVAQEIEQPTIDKPSQEVSSSSLPPLEKSFVPARFKPKGKSREGGEEGSTLSQTQVEMIHNIATATGAYPMVWDPQYAYAYSQTMYDPSVYVATNDATSSYSNVSAEAPPTSQPLGENSLSVDESTNKEILEKDEKVKEEGLTVPDNSEDTIDNDMQSGKVNESETNSSEKEKESSNKAPEDDAKSTSTTDTTTLSNDIKTVEESSTQRDSTPPLQETTTVTTTTPAAAGTNYTISAPSTPYSSYQYTDPSQAYAAYAMAYSPYYSQLSGVYDQTQYAAAMNYYAAYQAAYTGAYGAYYQQAAAQQQQGSSSTPVTKKVREN